MEHNEFVIYILNVFSEKELSEEDSVRKIGNSDFSTKPTNFYNLDVIISVEMIPDSKMNKVY